MTESVRDKQTGSSPLCCPVVELRQYTLHSGKRDVLIDLFDREFVETQEEVGMKIIGQFRDLDHQDRFVWLRGFRDMNSRAKALNDFYSGPVWKAHREAANATMIDSDNVLLLRPAFPTSGFSLENLKRAPVGADEIPTSLVVATIYYFAGPVAPDFINFFEHTLRPVTESLGATISASFVTENSENTFPALPVRVGRECVCLVLDLSGFGGLRKLSGRSLAIGTMAQRSLDRTDALSGKSAGSIKAITDRPVAITRLIQRSHLVPEAQPDSARRRRAR